MVCLKFRDKVHHYLLSVALIQTCQLNYLYFLCMLVLVRLSGWVVTWLLNCGCQLTQHACTGKTSIFYQVQFLCNCSRNNLMCCPNLGYLINEVIHRWHYDICTISYLTFVLKQANRVHSYSTEECAVSMELLLSLLFVQMVTVNQGCRDNRDIRHVVTQNPMI